jgi:hypothetical protein
VASPDESLDRVDADAYSVDELREAVFEGRGRLSRPLALALLGQKEYPDKVGDLQRILEDETEPPRLRTLAASALGRLHTPASVRALERGLAARDSVTLRAVAKALGEAGDAKHVTALEGLAAQQGPTGRDAERALNVLRRRLEQPTSPPDVGTPPLRATGEPIPIEVRPASAADAASAARSVAGRRLATDGAVAMECQGRQMVFVFDEASLRRGVDMVDRANEVGIVAEPPSIEGVTWWPRYRISVQPEERNTFGITVTTYDGRLVLTGRGTRRGRETTFELATAEQPGALPVELSGRFDGQTLTFDRAWSSARRLPAQSPSPER